MNSLNQSPAALPAAEEAEIAEYERIVAFAEQVMAGTDPRFKIPSQLVPRPTPTNQVRCSSPATHSAPAPSAALSPDTSAVLPAPGPVIDYRRDYYKVLGIQDHVKQDSILRAFAGKSNEYSPDSTVGRAKLESGKPNLIKRTEMDFKRIKEAFAILSVPELRKQYDDGRIRDRIPPTDRPIARPAPGGGRGARGRSGRGRGGRRE
ncbi:hypothetical protein BKA65DRAFT_599563 [Rhexocercosporidium sp. MPI-PUGE-AT-0058]|nr:hypothetical protein BKA65DRAFT_599563 [Rhexocercosporidium sp. MPI-PUGE-AT-0058]